MPNPVGGRFLRKDSRNQKLYQYHVKQPELTHAKLADIFHISRVRVTQILKMMAAEAAKVPRLLSHE